MREFLKKEWFKIVLSIVFISIIFIAYQTLVVIPQKKEVQETKRTEMMIAEQTTIRDEKEEKLSQCISEAYASVRSENARICVQKYGAPEYCKSSTTAIDECACEVTKIEDMVYLGGFVEKAETAEKVCYQRFE